MFSGEFEHSVDDKGRLIIPISQRPQLSEGAFITRGFESCLFIFPLETWQDIADQLNQWPTTRAEARFVSRLLFSGNETTLDKQGRISISPPLREHAGIELGGEVVVVGVNNRVELWNKERWKDFTAMLEQEATKFADELGDFTF
ncbi:MAG: division/cell wall cluster transcriptional repressor MraZ [Anaerolineae bacterium]